MMNENNQTKVKISQIVKNQIPEYFLEGNENFSDFLEQYYISQEYQGSPLDILENSNLYTNIESFSKVNLIEDTTLRKDINFYQDDIFVESIDGWPKSYGLLKIDDEIITYKESTQNLVSATGTIPLGLPVIYTDKLTSDYIGRQLYISGRSTIPTVISVGATFAVLSEIPVLNETVPGYQSSGLYDFRITNPQFTGCIRGFSGVESFNEIDIDDNFVFLDTVASNHDAGTQVQNLSNLFLRKFFEDFKYQYAPGFESLDINSDIETLNLTRYVKDFYNSKGTDKSFRILFDILFGVDISITKPATQLFTPSDGQWVENRFLIVEDLTGDIRKISKGTELTQGSSTSDFPIGEGITYYSTDIPQLTNGKYYSKIGFDLDTLSGTFENTASTKVTEESVAGSKSIFVDSTVGFPESGTIFVKTTLPSRTTPGIIESFTYESKTNTQFLGCIGLGSTTSLGKTLTFGEFLYEDNLLSGTINGKKQYFAVSNVVSEIKKSNTRYLSPEDKVNIKSFGYINSTDPIFTTWNYNIPKKYTVNSYSISPSTNEISFVIDNYQDLYINDTVGIVTFAPGKTTQYVNLGTISDLSSSVVVTDTDKEKISGVSTNFIFLRKKLLRGKSTNSYPTLNDYSVNVQNTYIDEENNTIYVSSSGLPSYEIRSSNNIKTFTKTGINTDFTITLSSHNYFDGQVVYYNATSLGIGATVSVPIGNLKNGGKYFIKKVDDNNIALCFNKTNVYKDVRIEINFESVTSVNHELIPDFIATSGINTVYKKSLTSQNLLKVFPLKPKTVIAKNLVPGINGGVGLFLNGVEALDSRSEYSVYYGSIEKIITKKSLDTFDVITPPRIVITDDTGYGVVAYPNLSGSIKSVSVEEKGFRFLEDPKAEIIGGNGTGAVIDAQTTLFDQEHILTFSSESSGINTTTDTITFSSNHNLITGDSVFYSSNSQTSPDVIRIVGTGVTAITSIGSIGINTTVITGIDTSGIEVGTYAINNYIPPNTKVTDINSGSIGIGTTTTNTSIITNDSFKFAVGIATTLAETSSYFVGVVSERSIKLYYTNDDSILKINNVNFFDFGEGNHTLTLNEPIAVIGDVRVSASGSNYRNKKVYVDSQPYPPENFVDLSSIRTGINTYEHYIFAKDHQLESGDIVEYNLYDTGTTISGIGTTSQYYVLKIDNDKFRLTETANISVATTSFIDGIGLVTSFSNITTTDFLDQEKYLEFSSVGVGTHIFKYPDITAKVTGLTAIGYTTLYQKVSCLGKIDGVYIHKGGSSYGSETVFNYEKQPKIVTDAGSGASIKPIIDSNGAVVDYVIKKGGVNYVGTPTLSVSGVGTGALLKPIVVDGTITSVEILEGGDGYSQASTKITVIPVGSSGNNSSTFRANIKSWNVNAFELHKKEMNIFDDGVILESQNTNYGNKYGNYSLPRELRFILNDNVTKTDIGYTESETLNHSPIVGWAYDGNPIYGPYGYSLPNSSESIKRLESGYEAITKSNRPSISNYPLGFFNEDYEFVNTGDLDEHNGRFGVTPEFPQGTYAYFCPISNVSGDGAFAGSREPVYPYLIGNSFRNEVINSNFKNEWDRNLLESKNTNLLKNLTPYNVNTYEFLDLTTSPKNDIFEIKSISTVGNVIDSIGVSSEGIGYKVRDYIEFDETGTGGSSCEAFVSSLVGKAVTSVVGVNTFFYNVKFDYQGTEITGITSIPHNLSTGDVIKVISIRSDDELLENDTTDSAYFKDILGFNQITVPSSTSGLTTDVSSYSGISGFTTFIQLTAGNLVSKFSVGDVVGIKSETMLVLNVDDINDRLRVMRGYIPEFPNSPVSSGIAYTSGDILELKSTKFSFNLPRIRFDKTVVNKRSLFFDPSTSVGLGTTGIYATYEVGIGSTSNQSRRFIKEQRIYLPNHNLSTGDQLLYNPGPGVAFSVSRFSDLSSPVGLGTTVFAIKRGRDHIGLSTNRVGLGTTTAGLYFVNIGSGSKHEFVTNYGESLIGDIQKSYAVVSLTEPHGLSEGDQVSLEVIPNQTITKKVKFDDINRSLIVGFSTVSSSDITLDSSGSSFTITNHGLITGDKIIYESNDPALPLENKKEYYVIKVDDNKIRLASSRFDATKSDYNFIKLTTAGSGIHTTSYVNPKIDVVKGNTLKLDLSDSSLSDFEFKFYYDKNFQNEFVGTGTYFENSGFETFYSGTPGSSGAYATLNTYQNIQNTLYYSIKLKDLTNPSNSNKIDFYPDTEVSNYCKIILKKSNFNLKGSAFDTDFGTSEFKISILPINEFETSSYGSTTSHLLKYTTTSESALGSIDEVKVQYPGNGYQTLPTIVSIATSTGDNAQLTIESKKIGTVNRYEIYNPTYDLPSDYTIRPILDFPIILKISDNYTISSVGVITGGKGYYDPPKPIAIDEDGNVISGLNFTSELKGQAVTSISIDDNKNNLSRNVFIIPTNNSNGYIIEDASFSTSTNTATLELDLNLTTEEIADIGIGTKIFVEGLESYGTVGVGSTTTTYNSLSNKYKSFEIVGINSSLKTVDYIITTGNPGTINPDKSNGYMIFEKNLAKFEPELITGDFKNDEIIVITKSDGTSERFKSTSNNGWNGKILKVRYENQFSTFKIEVGDRVYGQTSLQNGVVSYINQSTGEASVDFSYVNSIGWEKDYGKLSVSNQKLSDNVYYQKMSYDIKSTLSPTTWKPIVDSLNHTAGFKSFASTLILSEPQE